MDKREHSFSYVGAHVEWRNTYGCWRGSRRRPTRHRDRRSDRRGGANRLDGGGGPEQVRGARGRGRPQSRTHPRIASLGRSGAHDGNLRSARVGRPGAGRRLPGGADANRSGRRPRRRRHRLAADKGQLVFPASRSSSRVATSNCSTTRSPSAAATSGGVTGSSTWLTARPNRTVAFLRYSRVSMAWSESAPAGASALTVPRRR